MRLLHVSVTCNISFTSTHRDAGFIDGGGGNRHLTEMLRLFTFILGMFLSPLAYGASTDWVSTDQVSVRLITAETAVTPGTTRLSAALDIKLNGNWKTYWEFPGEVGLPPALTLTDAKNVAALNILYPTPTRFTAFEIENYGYENRVTYPVEVTLNQAGEPALIDVVADILICDDICIPAQFELALDLPADNTLPNPDTAALIADALGKVPSDATTPIVGRWSPDNLTVHVPIVAHTQEIDLFLHDATGHRYEKPDLTYRSDGRLVEIRMPSDTSKAERPAFVTIASDAGAYTAPIDYVAELPMVEPRSIQTWILAALFAFLGGLILNVMPCVLPVLSIKFAGVLSAQDKGLRDIRAGFLASAAGIITFALALAGFVIALRLFGVSMGLGMQFQSPLFLTFIITVLAAFAANLFGLFEFTLPHWLSDRLDTAGRKTGLAGDFLTGAFAALLATPCSAPFLGTAITYALTGSPLDALTVFLALGIGLAFPYILIAIRPQFIHALPKPGIWMTWMRYALGLGVLATLLWLAFVLSATVGIEGAAFITAVIGVGVLLWTVGQNGLSKGAGIAISVLALTLPAWLPTASADRSAQANTDWAIFSMDTIETEIAAGNTVIVDVTADWCLTCKANKALVLSQDDITSLLARDDVVALQADWTRPNEMIRQYLENHNRFGIPFNIVYGPDAPNGIALPELLTIQKTKEVIKAAHPSL
ncbi:MAG: protein-disulfide reductase DsbD domain-containing protein [Pseudomonadota bacterium]